MVVTLYCHSGNESILSIDPSALAIITLLHWYEVEFEIVPCSHVNESPSKKLPALNILDKVYSGYSSILRALKDSKIVPQCESENLLSLTRREFLLQMNHDLLVELFKNDEIFKKFTEPALLNAKSRYFWNFVRSRIVPLNNQIMSSGPDALSLKLKLAQKIEEMVKIAHDPNTSLESKFLVLGHLVIRSQLPKQYQFAGFDEFIQKLSDELDSKEFKGNILERSDQKIKPNYTYKSVEEYAEAAGSHLTLNAYTGLFGVLVAIAVLYSIKNR